MQCLLTATLLSTGLVLVLPRPVSARASEDAVATAARARVAEEAMDYEIAADLWRLVIADPATSPALLREAHLRSGVIQCVLEHDSVAHLHFRHVLLEDSDFELEPGVSPKILGLFEMVRAEVRAERAATSAPSSAPAPVTASAPTEARSFPTLLVAGASVAALGVVTAATGGALLGAAQLEHDAAATSRIQLERVDHLAQRDALALAGNLALAGAAGGLVLGGALVVTGIVAGP